jgi:hypothetical protein
MYNVLNEGATDLNELWRHSPQATLLAQAPPQHIGPKLANLVKQTTQSMGLFLFCSPAVAWQFADELQAHLQQQGQGNRRPVHALLEPIFARPVPTIALVLKWLQKRPELLELERLAALTAADIKSDRATDDGSYMTLWAKSVQGKCGG